MTQILAVLAMVELRGGLRVLVMKPKLMSWNVRGLNKGDEHLRVRNLLRQ
jgi:hypothetical protein